MGLANKPSSADLVLAVSQHLEQSVLPSLEGEQAFTLRVAIHALGIVERELRLGPGLEVEDQLQLEALLGGSLPTGATDPLIDALRHGELGLKTNGLLGYLIDRTKRRLSVDNPRYRHE